MRHLLSICPSVCRSVTIITVCSRNFVLRWTINVKEKAGGLTPTSSCFIQKHFRHIRWIFSFFVNTCFFYMYVLHMCKSKDGQHQVAFFIKLAKWEVIYFRHVLQTPSGLVELHEIDGDVSDCLFWDSVHVRYLMEGTTSLGNHCQTTMISDRNPW